MQIQNKSKQTKETEKKRKVNQIILFKICIEFQFKLHTIKHTLADKIISINMDEVNDKNKINDGRCMHVRLLEHIMEWQVIIYYIANII